MAPPTHRTATDNIPRALAWMAVSGLSFALMGAAVQVHRLAPLKKTGRPARRPAP